MFKKFLTLTLSVLIMNMFFVHSAFSQTSGDGNSRIVLNIKNTVARIGTEPNRKIKITLKDGTKLKGYITEIKDDQFSLFDKKQGKIVTVDYSQVVEAKAAGIPKSLNLVGKTLLVTGVVFGSLLLLGVLAARAD